MMHPGVRTVCSAQAASLVAEETSEGVTVFIADGHQIVLK